MSFIDDTCIYLLGALGLIAVTCLAWISSHVEHLARFDLQRSGLLLSKFLN